MLTLHLLQQLQRRLLRTLLQRKLYNMHLSGDLPVYLEKLETLQFQVDLASLGYVAGLAALILASVPADKARSQHLSPGLLLFSAAEPYEG
eukprot:jgi/Botrbrau1/22663/Bobra.0132s0009.1